MRCSPVVFFQPLFTSPGEFLCQTHTDVILTLCPTFFFLKTKKSKKKAKQSVKESKTVTDGKEPEEGEILL